jgi:hypothetical protein
MFPPHPRNKYKYCFEMRDYGGEQRSELEQWCLEDPDTRRWGNMGYVHCQKDEDAIAFILKWGIRWPKRVVKVPKVLDKETVADLGYSRVGLRNT